jgi:hypothetical protein
VPAEGLVVAARAHAAPAQARRVGDEQLVEQAALGGPRDPHVVVDVGPGIDLRAGVPPGGDMVAGGHDEGAEAQLASGHVGVLTP